ncbi:hypothetical protein AN7265.2 [Paecilomyces variotii No. 5]|uniref:Tat pathway signal sequence n=1 Tax=Byssochlamys spectabilis (strain No. 5 / NBRC 109023) TaxID=1356009 RepID=V5I372_BYSSN|nr:hypothetical protein AN7265.2 [Paecilomyces variotii No. 5]
MASTEDGEQKPFLPGEEESDYDDIPQSEKSFVQSWNFRSHGILFLLQIVLFTLNISFLIWNFHFAYYHKKGAAPGDAVNQVYTPAQSALQYKVENLSSGPGPNPFAGEPRPETDEAWSDLLRGGIVKISEDELRRLNKTSIPLRDGSGYIAYLEAIHMLHCVHPEHYPELQGTDAFAPGHWDHCLEVLRQGIMCNADITVNTYYWKNPTEIQGNRTGVRKCTDWSRIQEWADERVVDFKSPEHFLDTLVREH